MRTLEAVQAEYAQTCAKIGDLEVRKQRAIETVDAQLEPLHNKCNDLEKEALQIQEVQKELEALKNTTVTLDNSSVNA